MGETGYIGIMFQPWASHMEECISGDGGMHCIGCVRGSGIMDMKCWGEIAIGPAMDA